MRNPPPPVPRALIWRRHFLALAALSLLAGCGTTNGDFGEVRDTLVSDGIHDWVGPYATPARLAVEIRIDRRRARNCAISLIR